MEANIVLINWKGHFLQALIFSKLLYTVNKIQNSIFFGENWQNDYNAVINMQRSNNEDNCEE